jgi:glucan-binding YG repeat protein
LNYQSIIDTQFKHHNIYNRVDNLLNKSHDINEQNLDKFREKINKLDKQITEITLSAETQSAKLRHNTRWSPVVANISLYIKYWQIKKRGLKKNINTKAIETKLLDAMQDPDKSTLLKEIPTNTNIVRALRLTKKRKLIY